MRNEYGFTLIELIMVIVIIGILLLVAIQKYPTTEISLETAADMIRSDIRSVQALAMAQHASKTLTFNSSTEYVFPILGEGNKTKDLDNIFDGAISLNAYPASISFNSLGEPTAGYGSPITITTGSTTKTLTVLQYTGKVE
jgi:prepilin-type N-terminal cleavage/methylation domain-containing protein